MLKILTFLTLLWVAARFVYGIDFFPFVDLLGRYVSDQAYPVLGIGTVVALALPGITRAFEGFGWYSLMYSLAKLFFSLSTFLICLVSLAAVLFWFDLGVDVWSLLGLPALLPFIIASSAAFSLHIADFNYPVKEALVPLFMLAGLSLFIVILAVFYGV
ncbi:hypothetical protein [Desulfurivibrio dismutans]|uniref:hypothetical protein n=1 Tax=Desulfurivibrio dismutans TaxID=1398908 RepID=UPI0023DC7FC9|nr:hypothetical protein [Desulfurivibrio alkaliphilus]MDF1614134.1 hypothetical protein [Desulfurivibrio alkaliphilus]